MNLQVDGEGSWANRVTDAGDTPSVTLEALLRQIPDAVPFVLKLDIEGAESQVCQSSSDAVASFACIMIEPHDWMLPGSGGLAPLFTECTSAIPRSDPDLTLKGLFAVHRLNLKP